MWQRGCSVAILSRGHAKNFKIAFFARFSSLFDRFWAKNCVLREKLFLEKARKSLKKRPFIEKYAYIWRRVEKS